MLIRAVIFGAVAAASGFVAAAIVAETGYLCLDESGSVYRLLPWSQRERAFFIAHVMLYPTAALIGRALGRAWYGSASKPRWTWTAGATMAVGIVAFMVQVSLTQTFMRFDACGADNYDAPSSLGLGGHVVLLAVVAIIVGAISGLTVLDRDGSWRDG